MDYTSTRLLGPRTPTTARDALELKHRFEVLAECRFGGMQSDLELEPRFAELRGWLELLGRWHNPKSRDLSLLNGEIRIVRRLMTIFSDENEFDEEEDCRKRMRSLQTRIWFRKKQGNPLIWPVAAIRWYIDSMLVSMSRFATAVALWMLAFTGGFAFLKHLSNAEKAPDGLQTFGQALSSFFGTEPQASSQIGWIFLSSLATVLGFIHLGVFISHLYTLVSRR